MNKNPHAVALGRKGGRATSDAKAEAARLNGLKGGRPPNLNLRHIYNPMVARRCPRCNQTNSQFTEGGRLFANGPGSDVVGENPRAHRTICCVNCGHQWRGKLNRQERGIE